MAATGRPRQSGPMTSHLTTPTPLVLAPDEGEEINVRGVRILLKAVAPRVTVADYTAPPGFPGPPLHIHTEFDEVFLVLSGTLTMRVGEDVHEIEPGGTAFVAGSTPHTFANAGGDPLRFVAICAPGGFEDYFRALEAGDEDGVTAAAERAGYAAPPH
jgi:mannose-6-phosphate isomerase-like protein (cupin superfamily)